MTLRIAAFVVATTLSGHALADPLDDLLAKGNGSACFERVYDAAHLAKNPNQKTRSVLLSLRRPADGLGAIIRIHLQQAKHSIYIVGDCNFEKNANLDVMGEKLIEAFKGPSGLDCHAVTSEDLMSAEEGGDFPVDLRDGKSIVLYMPEELAGWPSFDRSRPAKWYRYGKDDQVFRVDQASPDRCAELLDRLVWPDD